MNILMKMKTKKILARRIKIKNMLEIHKSRL
jgi:hypothetical protein